MRTSRGTSVLTVIVLLLALVLVGYLLSRQDSTRQPPPPGEPRRPAPGPTVAGLPDLRTARSELATIQVKPAGSMLGYNRASFPHWSPQGNSCDTREFVLKRDGQNVTTDAACNVVSGTWISPYDGEQVTDPRRLDIDHMVPLANAWRSGAVTWTAAQREKFANDLSGPQLIATSARSNRAKGDKSPDQWKPPSTDYWCPYARAWTHVKYVWKLSVTTEEKAALNQMLGRCAQ